MLAQPRALLIRALESDDTAAIDALIRDHPNLLNAPNRRPAVTLARSVATADWLLSHGADVRAVGAWWAGGIDTLSVARDVGRFLVERGAALTPHAAAGLGLVDRLADLLSADPSLIDAKGVDACTPLHFARDAATARLLLERGARLNARDEDHESTPAQWLIRQAPEVSRFLLERGATPDIFLAAALGDRRLAERLIAADRACLAHRIGRLPEFPPIGHKGRGGTIYQWTLAFNSYAHQIALLKGHEALFEFLYENSDTPTRLLVSCLLARRSEAEAIAARNPGLVASLPAVDHELVARYCWETNTDYEAVRLMLDLGFPVAHPETSHGYSPLHNAAWAGSADLVDLLIERGHPVDLVDPSYQATPLGFAIYDCTVEKRHPEGAFGRVVKSLIEAGSPWEALAYPTGDTGIDEVLRPRMYQRIDGAALLGDEAALTRLMGATPGPDELTKALAGAAKGGHAALCRHLLQAGAPVNGSTGPNQVTPLMCAVLSASLETVALLLEDGADTGVKNAHGATALQMAVERGREEMVQLISPPASREL
ncbi:MAG: ankyrin repeat domain-containing protein [Acidobacteria bacterium]|nr:ankyrin repeat domain-containing protein [Acidobacteriota bacterium]